MYIICTQVFTEHCSIFCWHNLSSNYRLKFFFCSFFVCFMIIMQQARHTYFGMFLSFFFTKPLTLHQVGWGVSVQRYFQISPEMFKGSSPGSAQATQEHSQIGPEGTPLISLLCA